MHREPARLPVRQVQHWIGFAAWLLACGTASALEVGYLRLEREAGKPLRAEIPLTDRAPIVAAELRARVAARETFEVAGLRYHPALAKLQIQARQLPNGKATLVIEGLPADAGQLDLLLTVSDRSTLTIAEYRIETQSLGNEFAPARAGSSLGGQRPAASSEARTSDSRPMEARPAATAAPPPLMPGATTANKAPPAAAAAPAVAAAPPSPAPAKPAESRPPAAAADPKPALNAAVQAWAQSWSRRDASAYIATYAPGFVSADRSLSYEAWVAQRRQRIAARQKIDVRVESLEFETKGADWVASFTQHYQGDGLKETSRKQLLLRQIDGRWLIVGEREDR